jgi:hypothetical protein
VPVLVGLESSRKELAVKRLVVAVLSLSLVGTTLVILSARAPASAAVTSQAASTATLTYLGKTNPRSARTQGAETDTDQGLETREGPEEDREFKTLIRGSVSAARVPASHVPRPADKAVVAGGGTGFDGLTHLDQRLASGGTQFSLEPPDQALAVANGFVVEAVNTAVRVRSTSGGVLLAAIGLNEFFGLPPAIVRSDPPVFGPFLTDPRALFDRDTQRWFLTTLVLGVNPATGAFLPKSAVLIAVSESADPTGSWLVYSLDTTNATGTPDHTGCPCFGDQPLIGLDAYGFYVTTNEFPIFEPGFNGAQVYAMSKTQLTAGSPGTVVSFSGPPLAEGPSYTLQPATTTAGGSHATVNDGTEYFLSALEFTGTLDNRIAVWALTNTSSLDSASPALSLQSAVLDSQVYGQPPDAEQRPGPLPLADLIFAGAFGRASREHLPLIASNDDRMQQVTWAAGRLWSSLNTVVKPATGTAVVGAAWFAVEPSWSAGTLGGTVVRQGYVSTSNHSVLFPAVGVNSNGVGAIGFSLVGLDHFPSVAYAPLTATGTGEIHILAEGAAPADGFTGYAVFGGRTERWGDYSAATVDDDGSVWFASEYVPAKPRSALANWGTFIARVVP